MSFSCFDVTATDLHFFSFSTLPLSFITLSVVLPPSGPTTFQYLCCCCSDGRRKCCGCLAREHAERVSLAGHPRHGMLNGSREGLFELGRQLQQEGDSQAALHCFLSSLLGLTHVESFHSLPNCLHQVSPESAGWSSIKMHYGIKMIKMAFKCHFFVSACAIGMCCIHSARFTLAERSAFLSHACAFL